MPGMDQDPQARPADLGAFLRSRRAGLRPADVGLPDYGDRRRVPGLRREELARLAGVSTGYYTRLEQGRSPHVSDSVLDAVARALRLNRVERAHLHSLARPPRSGGGDGHAAGARPGGAARSRPETLRPAVRVMIDSFDPVPALVLGRGSDVLGWNRTAHALLAPHHDAGAPDTPRTRPNLARLMFYDPYLRELYADWPGKARDTVADLRLSAGRHPDDPGLATLIAELRRRSPEFAALWAAHTVLPCTHHTRGLRHPVAGPLTLTTELLALPDDDGQRVAVLNPAPGSRSEAALRTLAASVPTVRERPGPPGGVPRAPGHGSAPVADRVVPDGGGGGCPRPRVAARHPG